MELVFVMGPHRSGTTILYKLLAATGLFNVTTMFHVVNRGRLREYRDSATEQRARRSLLDLLAARGLSDREFDSVPVDADMPEEYAYALDHQGRRPRLNAANLPGFLAFCTDVQALQDPSRPLLLKNPFDADNFVYMRRALPGARFVFVHRRPAEVISSQIRAVRSILTQRNEYVALVSHRYDQLFTRPLALKAARTFYSARWPILFEQVARNVARINRYFVRHRRVLDRYEAAHVTYDGLCAAPDAALIGVLRTIGLPAPAPRSYADMVRPRLPELLPEVRNRLPRIERDHREYCTVVGL